MNAYLDFNIIVGLMNGELTIDNIYNIDNRIKIFPFSSSHIQEIDNIIHKDIHLKEKYIKNHLEYLSNISLNNYLNIDLNNNVNLIKATPFDIFQTINEIPGIKGSMRSFTNLRTFEQKKEFRNTQDKKAIELNNLSANEIIDYLNVSTYKEMNCNFMDLIEKSIELNPNGHTFGLFERFAAIFELLDLFGYYKDKETSNSNFARLWDSNHAFFASQCDYFITDDYKNRKKTSVAYLLYNIKTKVLNSKGEE